ncbi:hypothetical protein EDB84DRAFT_1447292 [Lactarius hengduanensis]|nr:hypothetical protein EDB84DRAFT_1447292 [Lactarius hengduanensis]
MPLPDLRRPEQPSLTPLTLFALNSPDTIPEYANSNADLASTSIVRFEDYADPTRARVPQQAQRLPRFHSSMVPRGYGQGMRNAASAVATPTSAKSSRSTSWRLWLALRFSSPTSVFLPELLQLGTTPNLAHKLRAEREHPYPVCAAQCGIISGRMCVASGSKGKEPAQLVGSRRAIKPTAKAQQASLTGFFSSRTVFIDGKESTQTSSANSGNSGPAKAAKQGDSTPTAGKGTQKRTKASVSVGPKKRVKTTAGNQDVESDTDDDQDFTIGDGEARGSDGGDDDTEEEGGYEQMRQDADQDRKGVRRTYSRTDDPRTRDIRQVFSEEIKFDVDGQKKKGRMCEICKRLGVSEKDTFFTSKSVSTLRTHIARLIARPMKKCKDTGVEPHPRAIGSDDNDQNTTLTQVNLDGFMQRIPTWTKQGLMEHVIQFVVEDDQSFLVVEKPSFRNMLRYLRPNMKDLDIPHRTKLQDEVIGWMTSDNASSNDKAGRYMQRRLHQPPGRLWVARERRIRCMEHTVHLAAHDFIQAINPTSRRSKTKASTGEPEEGGDDGEATGGDEDWTADWEELENTLDNEEVDDTVTFQPGDLLGKAIALITQIRRSPQANSYFQTVCAEEGVKPLELKKWVRTRWGSMYDLLERLLSSKLEPREAQATFSSEKTPTVWRTIPTLECLQERWELMARNAKFARVKHAIEKGLAKVKKWYGSISETDAYFVCLALDPTIKLEYCKSNWDQERVTAGTEALERIFDSYYQPPQLSAPTEPGPFPPNGSPQAPRKLGYAASWMRAAVQSRLRTEAVSHDPHKELKDYLESTLETNVTDPVRLGYRVVEVLRGQIPVV